MKSLSLITLISAFASVFALPSAAVPSVRVPVTDCPAAPTTVVTVTEALVSTFTVTTGAASTSYVFKPGNPPQNTEVSARIKKRSPCKASSRSSSAISVASVTTAISTTVSTDTAAQTSTIVSNLTTTLSTTTASISTTAAPTTTDLSTSTEIHTTSTTASCPSRTAIISTVTVTAISSITVTAAAIPVFSTVYPCATPLINQHGPAYGDSIATTDLNTGGNTLFPLNDPQGASPEACCNTCFFDSANCVQAYWYSYEGCVVSQAKNLAAGTGFGVSQACPVGQFGGLTYVPDTRPAFRSTGNIAGPCGQGYSNF